MVVRRIILGFAIPLSVFIFAWGSIGLQVEGFRPLTANEKSLLRMGDMVWFETCTLTTVACPNALVDECTGKNNVLACGGFGMARPPECWQCQGTANYKTCGGTSYTWCNSNNSGVVPCGAMKNDTCDFDYGTSKCKCPTLGPAFTNPCRNSDCT